MSKWEIIAFRVIRYELVLKTLGNEFGEFRGDWWHCFPLQVFDDVYRTVRPIPVESGETLPTEDCTIPWFW